MIRSLIEQWFPAAVVGAESLRERGASSALPPINFLHVWWARRPLTSSRAVVVASLLPAWPTDDEAEQDPEAAQVLSSLEAEFPNGERAYHAWFVQSLGILGNPVAARARIADARAQGTTTKGNAYGYDRAFTVTPDEDTIARIHRLSSLRGIVGVPTVLDPFSGGGSIPFEAARYGCSTVANELNPVACAVLNGTVNLPGRLGPAFAPVIEEWGMRWAQNVRERLQPFFHQKHEDERNAFIWAHTVPCPTTGRPTPLVPNFHLATGKAGRDVAVRLDVDRVTGSVQPVVVEGWQAKEVGNRSTYSRGTATSIWDDSATLSSREIKRDAVAGRMGEMLLAVSVTRPGVSGRQFRAPSQADLSAVAAAQQELGQRLPAWDVDGMVPTEEVFEGKETQRCVDMGITHWRDMFTDRQLLTAVTALEELRRCVAQARDELGAEKGRAVGLYLALMLDKCVDYNGMLSSWDSTRLKVRNTFDRHDFAFKWTFAEFDGANSLLPWAVNQVVDAYRGIAKLTHSEESIVDSGRSAIAVINLGSATALDLSDSSVDVVVTDPPYYDNVMYAECSDYFYVWDKRSLRDTWAELTQMPLTDKEREAVANPSLFEDVATHSGRGKRAPGTVTATELADKRYEKLLTDAFREAHRVLKPAGILTVMFTHKRVDAWDTLGAALLEAGFEISSSWPVHTESEHSLHQAKKNSASSTIMLGCRRRTSSEPAYWDQIQAQVETAAEEAAQRFAAEGIRGVDLTLATYGPALSVLSRNWPVYTGNLDADGNREVIRPDVALDLARQRVAVLKKRELLGGRSVDFDRATDWWLLAWNDFQAAQFPAGEALKLSIATDVELDDVLRSYKLAKATSGDVTLLTPAQRRTAGGLNAEAVSWPTQIDALHALMLIHDEEGLSASRAWLHRAGRDNDERFTALVEAALNAVPRNRDEEGEFVRPEARILESLRVSLFDQIEAPAEVQIPTAQISLFDT